MHSSGLHPFTRRNANLSSDLSNRLVVLAAAALFLISDEAAFVSGAGLLVGGSYPAV